jgi:hypothetical protein
LNRAGGASAEIGLKLKKDTKRCNSFLCLFNE